jgi:hypothetical protein
VDSGRVLVHDLQLDVLRVRLRRLAARAGS